AVSAKIQPREVQVRQCVTVAFERLTAYKPAALRRVISVRSVAIDLRATALAPWSASTVSIKRTYVMNKQLLCAAFAGAVATLALAQSPGTATSNGSTDAAAATRVAPMA